MFIRYRLDKYLAPSTKNVVVLAGAGISTPSGLPDFRSKSAGLYDSITDLPDPHLVFDIDYFRMNPKPFFKVAQKLYPGEYAPNEAHWFVRVLQDKQKLLRMYTQNIDGLESLAGVDKECLIEAHGTFSTATCQGCGKKFASTDIRDTIFAGQVPECDKCNHVIKPDVVFFGEMLPNRFMTHLLDMPRTDLVIVMGTSLEVYPFSLIVDAAWKSVPRLLINQYAVGSFVMSPRPNDAIYEGDIVEGVRHLAEACDWSSEIDALNADYQAKNKRSVPERTKG